MASIILKNSERHRYLVNECNHLLSKLDLNEYIIRDMGTKIHVSLDPTKVFLKKYNKKIVKISGLYFDMIEDWNESELEKLYSKLAFILMRTYETEFRTKK